MLKEALGYLRASDDLLFTVLLGGLLTFFSWLFIPWFIILGYILEVIERTSNGNEIPPVFENWTDLLISGFLAFIIILVYGLIPLFFAGIVTAIGALGTVIVDQPRLIGFVGLAFGVSLLVLTTIIMAYIVPAALANFVESSTLGGAFSYKSLKPVLTSKSYVLGWSTAAVIVLSASIFAVLIGVLPFVGWFIGAIVIFYAYVSAFSVIGRVWAGTRPIRP